MSSKHLENYSGLRRPAADRLLVLLKTRGPQTAADLAAAGSDPDIVQLVLRLLQARAETDFAAGMETGNLRLARAASIRFWASSFFLKSSSLPVTFAFHQARLAAVSNG